MSADETLRSFEKALEAGDARAALVLGPDVLRIARGDGHEATLREALEDIVDDGGCGGGVDRLTDKPLECTVAVDAGKALAKAYGIDAVPAWRRDRVRSALDEETRLEALRAAKDGGAKQPCDKPASPYDQAQTERDDPCVNCRLPLKAHRPRRFKEAVERGPGRIACLDCKEALVDWRCPRCGISPSMQDVYVDYGSP